MFILKDFFVVILFIISVAGLGLLTLSFDKKAKSKYLPPKNNRFSKTEYKNYYKKSKHALNNTILGFECGNYTSTELSKEYERILKRGAQIIKNEQFVIPKVEGGNEQ